MMENAGLDAGIVIKEEGVVQTRFATYTGAINLRGNSYWPKILPAPIRLKAGKNYSVEISGVTDIAGNVFAAPVTVNFRVTNDAFSPQLIDPLNADLSAWKVPDSSSYTAGVVPESTTVVSVATPCLASYAALPPAGSSAALSYVWDTTGPWLIDVPLVSGPAHDVRWQKANHVLQIAIHGDASGTLFRFGVEDSTDLGVVKQEVGPWKKIDWYGWRFVDWDMRTVAPGTWIGTSSLDGTLRFSRLQFAQDTSGSARTGTIYVDQLQLSDVVTGVDNAEAIPTKATLEQNYPNPFNPTTGIRYQVSGFSRVDLRVFDMLGREIATLVNEVKPPGSYRVTWDASNVPSGIYFCRLLVGNFEQTRKMVVLK
jgi:hypothetical protein